MKNICKNLKHLPSVIKMKSSKTFTPIQFSNYNILFLSCWFRGKSVLSPPKRQSESSEQVCKEQYV